ncbi:MAG: hypothetical protein CME64_06385 [Halobacteriovoraceae bacterium]|nr:hypothetical protein [Halobacteriovoraceae bacterium]|tara:strand:+ start:71284 stop:72348 length:1065 start_codon:yes stop_codon:yes gene_type:complete
MQFLEALWGYIAISAPYLLLGLILSGFIKQFIPMEKVKKWLGKDNFSSVFKASLVGVPLPLCSCSVIPTAVTLRKSGASKASTSSFLISTPESGVDSIAVTYAMMDLPMTILRPIAAFFSAFVAGALQMFFNKDENEAMEESEAAQKSCCGSGMKKNAIKEPMADQVKNAFRYGFKDLIDDIAFWLLIGLVLGAIIQVLVPENFFQHLSLNQSRLLILAVGVPVYICASATTPIAASLILKGMSPGTALLLLLVGPATNASNIMVLQKYIGKKGVFLNVLAVIVVALAFSFITDYMYLNFFETNWAVGELHDHEMISWWEKASGVILSALIIKGVFKEKVQPWFENKGKESCCS